MTVTAKQISVAKIYLTNVDALAAACNKYKLPFYFACTILDKETDGANIFGHDRGGAMYGAGEVTEAKYLEFRKLIDAGHTSNGVGPMQITWKGFFPDMEKQGLKPWVPADNILYGVEILAKSWTAHNGNIHAVATAYNGNSSYGDDAVIKAKMWKSRVGTDDLLPDKPNPIQDFNNMTPEEYNKLINDIAAKVLNVDGYIKNNFTGNVSNQFVSLHTALEAVGAQLDQISAALVALKPKP